MNSLISSSLPCLMSLSFFFINNSDTGQLGQAPAALSDTLPSTSVPVPAQEDEEEIEEMKKRLEALKS